MQAGKREGIYMAQSTIRRVKAKLDNYITISDLLGNYITPSSFGIFSASSEKVFSSISDPSMI